jgi:lipid-A-disaccharide synthase
MPNLIAGRQIVPELLQNEFTPHRLAEELKKIIDEGPARRQMLAALAEVRDKLKFTGASGSHGASAVERAADAVFKSAGVERQ